MTRDTEGSITIGSCVTKAVGGVCTVTVPTQKVTKGLTYLDLEHEGGSPKMDVDVQASITGLGYTAKGLCLGFEAKGTNAEYKGSVLIGPTSGEGSFLVDV